MQVDPCIERGGTGLTAHSRHFQWGAKGAAVGENIGLFKAFERFRQVKERRKYKRGKMLGSYL